MKKEFQTIFMHHGWFGERKRLANKTSQALSKCVVPTFHMSCFACFLSDSRMLFFWDHRLIRSPEISEAETCTIGEWNSLPQAATGLFASISHSVSNHLTRLAAQCYPDPRLVRLFGDKGPELIQFQDRRSRIGGIGCNESLTQGRKLSDFF
jgi:hypothetical protein